jgi:hypothetical protein
MKIHLVRSPELKKETFHNVVNVLNQYPGPLEFIAIEDGGVIPGSSQTRTWDNDEDFKKKEIYDESLSIVNENRIRYPFIENMRTWEQLFEHCELYRAKNRVSNHDLVVLLTDHNNDRNWFGGVAPNMKDYFIQTSNWEAYFGDVDVRFPIAYEVIVWAMRYYMFANNQAVYDGVHHTPIGCIMDFCQNKSQIILKMRTADVCPDCMNVLRNRDISPYISKQFFTILDGIRAGVTFRGRTVLLFEPSKLEISGLMKRIKFTDIGNLELRLNPKEKTLYLLYLAHPEGIMLNNIQDFRKEVEDYYFRFAVGDNEEAKIRAIDLLLNPLEGDRDTVISRINSIIRNTVGDELAEFYSIKGERGGAKKIKLDREKVVWN